MAELKSAPGASEVASWQNQIIKPAATISGNQTVSGTSNPVAVELYNMSRANRQQIALALKNAGYRVPTNGLFSDKLLNAYQSASMAAQIQAQQLGRAFDSTYFTNYLVNEAAANVVSGKAAGGPSKTVQTRVSDPTTAKALIDAVIRDQLGRAATEDEVAKYTKALRKAQKNAPVVTTYTTTGGTTTSRTTGGVNEQQFLIDKIAGTDEARANSVLGYYEAFMNALGRD